MTPILRTFLVMLLAAALTAGCGDSGSDTETTSSSAETTPVSGRIEDGLRVLTVDPAAADQEFTIYRGDYVRVETSDGGSVTLASPALDVNKTFPAAADEKAYFKVPDAGAFPFSTNAGGAGVIHALELREARYTEVSVDEAVDLIHAADPFILDVRTPREYAAGHLKGSVLIPIQELQGRVDELASHKEEPVFVYCRTGNRSTVAARLLLDEGFKQVINLRRGITAWERAGKPVVR